MAHFFQSPEAEIFALWIFFFMNHIFQTPHHEVYFLILEHFLFIPIDFLLQQYLEKHNSKLKMQ